MKLQSTRITSTGDGIISRFRQPEPHPEEVELAAELDRLDAELQALPDALEQAGSDADKVLQLLVRERTIPNEISARRRRLDELETQRLHDAIGRVTDRRTQLVEAARVAKLDVAQANRQLEEAERDLNLCSRELRKLSGQHHRARQRANGIEPDAGSPLMPGIKRNGNAPNGWEAA